MDFRQTPATMAPAESAAAAAPSWTVRAPMAWIGAVAVLLLVCGAARLAHPAFGLADLFLWEQDLPVAVLTAALMLVLRFVGLRPLPALGVGAASGPWRIAAVIAVLAGTVAMAGWALVCRRYPLSMDEFLATFDAAIFRQGHLSALVPEAWRGFMRTLQPQYMLYVPDGASWTSAYLPVNAMVRAAFERLGSPALAGAAWAVLAIAAVFGVARRLWPARPDAALLAALLLASSSQFLITAMTPYANAAHLALNMAWLWLFLRGGRVGHAGAAGVALLACGLHQVVFPPLFAGPFILELWLARRWRPALFHTLVYAAIGLFWISYWRLMLPAGPPATGAADVGAGYFQARVVNLLTHVDPAGWGLMAKNLLRFTVWQNPLTVALALWGGWAAVRAGGLLRAVVLGMAATVLLMTVILPTQGHGWGYRYLHGFLGGLCLLAAYAWIGLTQGQGAEERRRGWTLAVVCVGFSLLVLLPVRAWQVRGFIAPYAEAYAAIARADADVVAVDATGMFYAEDLVRNDPWLRNRPKVIDLVAIDDAQIRALCATQSVVVFDRTGGFGIRPSAYPPEALAEIAASRALMRELSCGRQVLKAAGP